MKGRRKKLFLLALISLVTTVAVGVVWLLYGPFSFASAAARAREAAALLRDNDPQRMLAEANRFYWAHNLPLAAPLYSRAQVLFSQAHDARDALYAQIGVMRTEDQSSFPDMSAFIATELAMPLVQNDPFLRLWCLGVKGEADRETNVGAAEDDWHQVMQLATSLGQKEWVNRARGELGIVAFLRGDYRTAVGMIGTALITAALEGDAGTEVRYLELVGNGLNGLNRASEGMYFLDRAIRISKHDGYVGTAFMAYEGRADALASMGHRAEAVSLMENTLAEARREKMWEHEGQDLLFLGEFARHMGQPAKARAYLAEAGQSAKRMGMSRVVAQSYFDLAELSKTAGDLKQATSETEEGVHYMSLAGDTVYLPNSLEALAALKAQAGEPDEAHRLYRQPNALVQPIES